MANITRDNHFVPQFYLNGWANEGKIYRYDLLVPSRKTPLWVRSSVKNTAFQRDLYTRCKNDKDSDDVEQWFGKYESKASDPIKKAREGKHIDADDWACIIDYIAVQSVRTFPAYMKSCNLLKKLFPDCIEEATKILKNGTVKNNTEPYNESESIPFHILLDAQTSEMNVSTTIGKETWFYYIKHLVEGEPGKELHKHNWGIITCDEKISWPTSDDPVIYLNYYSDDSYNFNGGWGAKGVEIIMPISPSKAVYTKIGSKASPRFKANYQLSAGIRDMIIRHAFRQVYSNVEDNSICNVRPRKVDNQLFIQEKKDMETWYLKYLSGEYASLKTSGMEIVHKQENESVQ